jgi:MFS family permease
VSRRNIWYRSDVLPDVAKNTWWVLLVVGLGTFLSAMAGSSVTLILPTLGKELAISLDALRWVVLSYLLVLTALLLVAGTVGDWLGLRRVYLLGFLLFGISSFLCGVSDEFWLIITARIMQGMGGAMILATGPALLTTSFPSEKRGKALGILSTATYAGLTIGPPLGGWILGVGGWRWVFWLNLPIAALVVSLGAIFLPRPESAKKETLPWRGWIKKPLLDLGLFRSRLFTGSVLSALCNYFGLFVPNFLMPFYLEQGRGVKHVQIGLILSIQPLAMSLVAATAGWLSDRIGSRGLTTIGMLVMAGGLLGLSRLGVQTPIGLVFLWMALIGLGTGIFISPNSSALMGSAPQKKQGMAGGIMALARNLGMLIGVAVGTIVFQSAGGETRRTWGVLEFNGFGYAMIVAAGVVLVGAVFAALRGKGNNSGSADTSKI